MARTVAVHKIEGRHHPLVKRIRSMVRSGELLHGDEVLLETPHLIDEALASRIPLSVIVSTDAPANARSLLARLPDQTAVHEVPSNLFEQLTTTESSRGILALAKGPAWREEDAFRSSQPLVIVVVGLQDAGNLGTILRTAEAFGASALLLTEGTVSPFNSKCIRAAAGALFRVPILRGLQSSAIVKMLAQRGIPLFATASGGDMPLPQVRLPASLAVAFGSEGAGLPEEWLRTGTAISIPMAAHVESLNVAASAAIVLYEIARQRANEIHDASADGQRRKFKPRPAGRQ